MKTSVIKSSKFAREWNNPKGGVIYYHDIQLENGDKGSIGSKDKMPDFLKEGKTLSYTIEGDKIKKAKLEGFSPRGNEIGMTVGAAFNNAVALCCHGKIEKKDIPVAAKWIANESLKLKKELESKG